MRIPIDREMQINRRETDYIYQPALKRKRKKSFREFGGFVPIK